MKKKTQRTISRIILGAILLFVIIFFSLPLFTQGEVAPEETTPTTTAPMETILFEATEATAEPVVETTEPTPEPTTEVVTEPVPEPTRQGSFYNYTEDELDLLARLINAEGGGESYETKLKIGSVVMNRVARSSSYTIEGVIYSKNQFSVTFLKRDGIPMIDYPASEESYRAAKEVLDYGSVLPETVQVFYAVGCKESWVTSRAVYDTCDNTVFAHIYKG